MIKTALYINTKENNNKKENVMEEKYIGYDYKEIIINKKQASFLLDSYKNFGWDIDRNFASDGIDIKNGISNTLGEVRLQLKRDRNIINKMELTRLQRNYESCLNEIEKLENSKTSKATVSALSIGLIGTVFMAGSVFAITAASPNILLCIIFAIPAFAGWILPYFIYKKKVMERTEIVAELIEMKYNEIHEICEKGKRLLS